MKLMRLNANCNIKPTKITATVFGIILQLYIEVELFRYYITIIMTKYILLSIILQLIYIYQYYITINI